MSRGRRVAQNREENRVAKTIDKLREFEKFEEDILPKMRAMLKAGKKSAEIRDWVQSYLTAREVTIALTSTNEKAALQAISALTHQNEGRPKERIESTHKFEKLKDEELDALLQSRLAEVDEQDEATTVQ